MAFDKVNEIMKPPAPKPDLISAKPFGRTPVDPLTGNPIYKHHDAAGVHGLPGLGDPHAGNHASLIKLKFANDKVRVFTDPKGIAERTEMDLEEGQVFVYKDYDVSPTTAHYKKIDILGRDGHIHGTIDLIPNDRTSQHTSYKCIYDNSMLGSASGDIGLFVAQALVSQAIAPRTGSGTGIDGEVITTIRDILKTKRG